MKQKSDTGNCASAGQGSMQFVLPVLAGYTAVVIAGILFHPMWRDELHPWGMAGASTSPGNLMQLKAIEGHPDLWYLLVYWLRMIGPDPWVLQAFHAVIAVCTAFLVLRHAPFSKMQKILLLSGYFYVFEYAVISRNYAIGVLMVTLFLVLYRQSGRHLITCAIILAILAQASVFGLIMTMAFTVAWCADACFRKPAAGTEDGRTLKLVAGLLVILAGIAWSLYSVIPDRASYFSGTADFSFSQLTLREVIRSVSVIWHAWIPLPYPGVHFWNSSLIGDPLTRALLSIALFGGAFHLFRRHRIALILLLTGTGGIVLFILMYYFGYLRHHGHLFILLVSCFWLTNQVARNENPADGERQCRWRSRILTTILSIHLVAGAYALGMQFFVPFSASGQAAGYIRQQRLDRFMIAGDRDVCLESIAVRLDKPLFFFSRNDTGRYLAYDDRRRDLTRTDVVRMADSLSTLRNDTLLLVLNYLLPKESGLNTLWQASFTESIQPDEVYHLYLLLPHPERRSVHSNDAIINIQESQ